jgi:hypothetical protein
MIATDWQIGEGQAAVSGGISRVPNHNHTLVRRDVADQDGPDGRDGPGRDQIHRSREVGMEDRVPHCEASLVVHRPTSYIKDTGPAKCKERGHG